MPFEFDAFISYSWNFKKDLVNSLFEFLDEKGYSIWKDDEGGMHGSTVRSMQQGVDASKVMIICVSDAYLTSHNCRLELNYG